MENQELTFAQWVAEVDEKFTYEFGLRLDDVEDMPTRAWYDEGLTVRAAVDIAIEAATDDIID